MMLIKQSKPRGCIKRTKWKRNILSQGDCDSSCFLYGLLNAYKILTKKTPTKKFFNRALEYIPFSKDFQSYDTGTQKYGDDTRIFTFTIENVLRLLSNGKYTFEVKARPPMEGQGIIEETISNVSESSVVLLGYAGDTEQQKGLDHWLVVVGYGDDPPKLFVACSAVYMATHMPSGYYERKDPCFGRLYNDVITEASCNGICEATLFQIRML